MIKGLGSLHLFHFMVLNMLKVHNQNIGMMSMNVYIVVMGTILLIYQEFEQKLPSLNLKEKTPYL